MGPYCTEARKFWPVMCRSLLYRRGIFPIGKPDDPYNIQHVGHKKLFYVDGVNSCMVRNLNIQYIFGHTKISDYLLTPFIKLMNSFVLFCRMPFIHFAIIKVR